MGFQEIERQVASKWSKKGSPYNSYNKLSYGLEREAPTIIHNVSPEVRKVNKTRNVIICKLNWKYKNMSTKLEM